MTIDTNDDTIHKFNFYGAFTTVEGNIMSVTYLKPTHMFSIPDDYTNLVTTYIKGVTRMEIYTRTENVYKILLVPFITSKREGTITTLVTVVKEESQSLIVYPLKSDPFYPDCFCTMTGFIIPLCGDTCDYKKLFAQRVPITLWRLEGLSPNCRCEPE